MKQSSFFESKTEFAPHRISYGGDLKIKRMSRPLNPRKPLHIVMKSSVAKGKLSLLSKRLEIDGLLKKWAKACDVKMQRRENMGNHLHLLISFQTRKGLQKFLRVISGLIARLMTNSEKGRKFGQRFWDATVFTRVITGFKDRLNMQKYMTKNEVERDHGPALREAMELYEEVHRRAKRRKVPLEVICQEMLEKLG